MKIYRGPQTGDRWKETAAKNPRDYIEGWQPGTTIAFNATIEGVQRFTEVGVQIEEDDVIALFSAFIEGYRRKQPQLLADLETSRAEVMRLRRALREIYRLIAYESPSEETLKAVRSIALEARMPGSIQS
jgi:hypothetical protein